MSSQRSEINKRSSSTSSGTKSTSDMGSRTKSTRKARPHGENSVNLRFTVWRTVYELPTVHNPIF